MLINMCLLSEFSVPFNKTESKDLPPISIVGDFPVVNGSVDCSSDFKASLAVDISSNSNAQVGLSVVAAGKLLPPSLDEFALVTGKYIKFSHPRSVADHNTPTTDLTADLRGTLKVNADVQVSRQDDVMEFKLTCCGRERLTAATSRYLS